MIESGDINGVDITREDLKLASELFGASAGAIKGKTTKKQVGRNKLNINVRTGPKTPLELFSDVFSVDGQKFILTLANPIKYMICSALPSEKTNVLGGFIQQHINLFRSRNFDPRIIHLDPQPGFRALVGQFGEIDIDIMGAGDHIPEIDIRIRRIKEMVRSVMSQIKWNIPKSLIKDLVLYTITRLNSRRDYLNTVEASPRVLFSGYKQDFASEFSIGFGDYCECNDHSVTSNDATQSRTNT